jgi:hypothetical protein
LSSLFDPGDPQNDHDDKKGRKNKRKHKKRHKKAPRHATDVDSNMIVTIIQVTTASRKRPPRIEKGAGGKAKDARSKDDPTAGKKSRN